MVARAQPRLSFRPVWCMISAENQCDAARKLGLAVRVIHRYVHGGIPLHSADRVAAAAGAHPNDLWGGAWQAAHTEYEDSLFDAREYNRAYYWSHREQERQRAREYWRRNHPEAVA